MQEILVIPNPILSKPVNKVVNVSHISDTLTALCGAMYSKMEKCRGVGLAANQIGVDMSLFVATLNKRPYYFINPEILEENGSQFSLEGCLSVPTFIATVTRPTEIKVKWQSIDNRENIESFYGYEAAIVKHEIDHLEGKLFIDMLPIKKRYLAEKKVDQWKRRQKKRK